MQHNEIGITNNPRSSSAKDRQAVDFEADAMSVDTFARRNGIGKVKAYAEIKAGRLNAMKVGSRTLITQESAYAWRQLCQQGGLKQ